jgi:hypothetical protein
VMEVVNVSVSVMEIVGHPWRQPHSDSVAVIVKVQWLIDI